MIPDPSDTPQSIERAFDEKDDLVFLRDEGLELLAAFKRVRDPKQRRMLLDLIVSMARDREDDALL